MATIRIKRGLQADVQNLVLAVGEMAVAIDTGNVYIGTTAGNHHINPTGGTADVATKLAAARAFSITGDGTASGVNFDGTANVALALTLATMSGLSAGTYTKLTVDTKGRVTAGAQVAIGDISGLGTAASKNTGKAAGNVVILETDGKIDASLIPSLAITDVFEAANQAAMLALSTAGPGDVCVRSDENKSYILKASPASTLANWVWLRTPDSAVLSVAGKTGVVTLAKADVGLSSVDNTADASKSVLSASKLTAPVTIGISGGATGTATSFDGSANITIPVTALDVSKATAGTLPLARGGTNATDAATARTNLGITPANIGAATSAQGSKADSALQPAGDGSNLTAAFTQATTRENLTTGEKLSAIFGKLMKWFADLKTVAFTGAYSDLTGAPTSMTPTAHATTATTYGASSATNYGHAIASSATPLVAGTAAVGTDNGKFAREGHVHPVQTSVSGNAGTATTLAASRAFSITGGATTAGVSFNGGGDVALNVTSLDASKLSGDIDGGTF